MRYLVTGSGGFVGRLLCARLLGDPRFDLGELACVDECLDTSLHDPRVVNLPGKLPNIKGLNAMLDAADVVVHLAAVPGGASEMDPAISRRVNLDATLAILDRLAVRRRIARIVYASTIGIFGVPLPPLVDDETLPRPTLTYGAHKLMAEIALADHTRRGTLDGWSLRLPGLVTRPSAPSGMRSAFLSEVFHAAAEDRSYRVPTNPDATVWIMSARRAVANLLHAALISSVTSGPTALTLPALRVTMRDLVGAVAAHFSIDTSRFIFDPDDTLEAQFARYPPLATPRADSLGFAHDGNLAECVRRAATDAGLQARALR